jgi:Domain of unknown function (DUF4160)
VTSSRVSDCNEPAHVHVRRERMVCKFWIEPVALAQNHGFSAQELNQIRTVIQFKFAKDSGGMA